jgi:hypothetical protein
LIDKESFFSQTLAAVFLKEKKLRLFCYTSAATAAAAWVAESIHNFLLSTCARLFITFSNQSDPRQFIFVSPETPLV